MSTELRRFPRRLYRLGNEPDARFSLANERTFLAWIRTSLALIAGGVALQTLASSLAPGFRLAAAIILIVAGIAAPVQAWTGWALAEASLRSERPLPSPALAIPVALSVLAAGILILLGIILK